MTNPKALSEFLDAACAAARRGAAVLEEWRRAEGGFKVREKGRFDLVTEADLGSQRAIRETLAERYPEHAFLGEEPEAPTPPAPPSEGGERGGGAHGLAPGSPPTWIVDPLDGTTNYVHGCPMYCVSIGLHLEGELAVGVILDPAKNELFTAAQGQGAWLNGQPLRTSRVERLDEALLATGFPPDLRGQERMFEWWRHFSLRTHSLRRTGSTALNLAYVAAGRFDGYWAFDNHVWDVAGGAVLIREAGGLVSNVDGSPYDPHTPDMLASNGPLHPVLVECFRKGL